MLRQRHEGRQKPCSGAALLRHRDDYDESVVRALPCSGTDMNSDDRFMFMRALMRASDIVKVRPNRPIDDSSGLHPASRRPCSALRELVKAYAPRSPTPYQTHATLREQEQLGCLPSPHICPWDSRIAEISLACALMSSSLYLSKPASPITHANMDKSSGGPE